MTTFAKFLLSSVKGDVFEYHRGNLAASTGARTFNEETGARKSKPTNPTMEKADAAWAAYLDKKVTLVQRRVSRPMVDGDIGSFSYLAVKL